ncbi:MAG: hypothetical protein LBE75_05340 [Burkholderiales bacterium]|jgi:hypothetical protein|nr:hypothetical protein [Burkholderiales bacterium]
MPQRLTQARHAVLPPLASSLPYWLSPAFPAKPEEKTAYADLPGLSVAYGTDTLFYAKQIVLAVSPPVFNRFPLIYD